MSVRVTLSDLIDDGELAGYKRGLTPYNALVDGVEEAVCAEATCSHCGHKGLDAVSFMRPGSRRAFTECPSCRHAEEF